MKNWRGSLDSRVRGWIASALEMGAGTHTLDDVIAGLEAGDYQLWTTDKAACVTEIIVFPRKKALNFWLMGGDLADAMERIEPVARAWGSDRGCSLFLGYAIERPGWDRALRKFGYAPGWRVFWRQ